MMHSKASSKMLSQLFTVITLVLSQRKLCFIVAWVAVVPPPTSRTRTDSTSSSWNPVLVQPPIEYIHHSQYKILQGIQSRRRTIKRLSQEKSLCETDATVPQHNNTTNLLDTLLLWFQGDFDNYRQVVIDRKAGLLPREYGGHEHIHCSLIPVTYTSRLAAFYFDGIPDAIFRFRFYRLQSTTDGSTVDTVLYTLSKDLEAKLRACSDVMQWPEIFRRHVLDQIDDTAATTDADIVECAILSASVSILPKCEVRWSRKRDCIQHSYVNTVDSNISENMISTGLHAIMVHGEALVDSQMIPGQKILIKDQLSLWDDQLWIHDRGYNPDTGAYIYGNQNGIPYRMQRVTDMVRNDVNYSNHHIIDSTSMPALKAQQRRITDTELAWTLGNDYRTPLEYESNMQVIGGSSRKK